MSIGATLAAARRRAGLTVSDVSQRTRVTQPIIQGIEHDDYAACGGDFYARGHIRAIAHAVGEDPSPLIDEFDSTWRSAAEITAAEVFQSAMPLRKRERRRVRWTAFLAVLVLAVLGFASYKFVSGVGRTHPAAAASPRPSPAGGHTNPPASAAVQGSSAQASATQASPRSEPSGFLGEPGRGAGPGPGQRGRVRPGRPGRRRRPAGSGAGDRRRPGPALDQPVVRHRAVRGAEERNRAAARHGPAGHRRLGAALPDQPLGRGHPAARREQAASPPGCPGWRAPPNAGGTVRLQPGSPVHVRYVLIWFTKLPPDNAGTYRASVYRITVQGHR